MDTATVDHLLTTTRSVRKRLDLTRAVEPEVIAECIEIALQAPTASNRQHWHFVVVTDPEKRAAIAQIYREVFDTYRARRTEELEKISPAKHDPEEARMARILDSARYLAEHLHEVPVLIIPCVEGRAENDTLAAQAALYGSILPAAWSLMLALRARGLGSAWTTFHLVREKEVAQLLGILDHITQGVLLPVAYFKGEGFRKAPRRPAREFTYWNRWENTE